VPLVVALTDIGLDFATDTLTFTTDTGNQAGLTLHGGDAHQSPATIALDTPHTLSSLGFGTSTLWQMFYVRADQIGRTRITGQ
ncbi:MAG: hypothetical protein GTO03_14360, partial [Planctomycetales bacterium]|nr:hypothetical protein [Planctomycetales bacterium]